MANTDRHVAYEVIAEPEWRIQGLYNDGDFRIQVPLLSVRSLVRNVVQAVHARSNALVTEESNRPSNMQYWQGLGLNYDSGESVCQRCALG